MIKGITVLVIICAITYIFWLTAVVVKRTKQKNQTTKNDEEIF